MRYRPKSNFVFGDVNLADYGGAFAFYCNIFNKPDRDIEVISVPGRNGDLLFDNGRYKNVERKYIVQAKGIEVAHALMNDLLNKVGYHKLTDEYDTAYYYMARLKSIPKIVGFVGDAVKMEIVFDRMPQRWLITDAEMVEEYDGSSSPYSGAVLFTVFNKTNNVALPKIEIQLSGSTSTTSDVTIQINVDETGGGNDGVYGRMYLNNVSTNKSLVLDSEKKAIYDPDTLENLSGKIYYNPFRWATIPTLSEGVRVRIVAARNAKFHMKAILNTRMWEL